MREATRRQIFGLGAGAIGVMAAPGSVQAVTESRPNDAKLLELEKRHEALFDEAVRLLSLGTHEGDRLSANMAERSAEVLDEMETITPDSTAGVAARLRACLYPVPTGGEDDHERNVNRDIGALLRMIGEAPPALASKGA